jgi:phosphatidylglycerophosphate synthase
MKVKKILLPKWVPWFVLVITFFTVLLSYSELKTQQNPNFTSFIITVIMFVFILFVLFLVSYRQIPYLLLTEVKK